MHTCVPNQYCSRAIYTLSALVKTLRGSFAANVIIAISASALSALP